MGYLSALTNLQFLNLNFCGIGNKGLRHLSSLTKIKVLSLYENYSITISGIKHLSFGRVLLEVA